MSNTRRQHYVWAHYLKAWTNRNSLCVLTKEGKAFATNPINVAQSRDFYRLPILTEEDERFVERWIETSNSREGIRQLNREAFSMLAIPSRVRRAMGRQLAALPSLVEALEQAEIQVEEAFFAGRESASVNALAQLRSGVSSFWHDENEALNFSVFVSQQLLRTKRMRENYLKGFASEFRGMAERTWFMLRICAVNGMGFSLFAERSEFSFEFLEAPESAEFITGDQPIRNLVEPVRHNDLALYYPVSPTRAVIFRHYDAPPTPSGQLTTDEVMSLNVHTYTYAHEMVFGQNASVLESVRAVI